MTTLLAASAGGHLAQLVRLAARLPWSSDQVWMTVDSPQSRSLLAGCDVVFVEGAAPRDVSAVLRNARAARAVLRSRHVTAAVSTGASVALSTLPLAAARRIPAYYVESAARVEGPSVTGRLLRAVPGVRRYCQYPSWAGRRGWHYAGSVFDGYEAVPAAPPSRALRVFVTLGTEHFSFRRLVERVRAVLPPDAEVVWQTGSTPVDDLGLDARTTVSGEEMQRLCAGADVIISHAGVGSALTALDAGRCPILIARRAEHGEHIDDHQLQIAHELDARGVAVSRSVEHLDTDAITLAASLTARRREAPPLLAF